MCQATLIWAGTYEDLEPGVSTRSDVDGVLGRPVREVETDVLFDYDPRGTGRRISIRYRGQSSVIDYIELEPSDRYSRLDYVAWFDLLDPTVTEVGEDGNRVEYHIIQGVSLHFDGSDAADPVVFFRHFDRDAFLGGGADEEEIGTIVPASTAAGDELGRCSDVLGIWRWHEGSMVECFDDRSCTASNGFAGPWECLDPTSGRLEIRWARIGQAAQYIDFVQPSRDGWMLEGANHSGQVVGGRRPEFSGGAPQPGCEAIIGRWLWANGDSVECTADGECSSSRGLSGPWRCLNSSGRFEIRWSRQGNPNQFIDTLLVSPLGSYLSGRNQHGVGLGAVRE
jgi:hypothetical protein